MYMCIYFPSYIHDAANPTTMTSRKLVEISYRDFTPSQLGVFGYLVIFSTLGSLYLTR